MRAKTKEDYVEVFEYFIKTHNKVLWKHEYLEAPEINSYSLEELATHFKTWADYISSSYSFSSFEEQDP